MIEYKDNNEAFLEAVERQLGDQIKKNDKMACAFWSALANIEWYSPKRKETAGFSFRLAGSIIADIRGEGDYLDWYCCGPVAEVSEDIGEALKKEGWYYIEQKVYD